MHLTRDDELAEIGMISEQYQRIDQLIPSNIRNKIQQIISSFDVQAFPSEGITPEVIIEAIKVIFDNTITENIDILVALIMHEFWQSEEQSLKELQSEMHRLNEARRQHHERLKSSTGPQVKRLIPNPRLGSKPEVVQKESGSLQKGELPKARDEDLDSIDEMSEMTSLRLQMTMDRRSKYIDTLSQIMKKVSTTQDSIIQNIK